MRLTLAAALLALAACQPAAVTPAEPTPEEMGQDDPGVVFESAPVGPAKTYEAMSKTAMSFTPGKLTVTPTPQESVNLPEGVVFAFENGITYKGTLIPGGASMGPDAKPADWANIFIDLSGKPIDPLLIVMYSVDVETVPPGTPNGGLCAKAGFLATYSVTSASGEDMTIAAFEGDGWPPASETALCGTFSYTLVK